MNTLTIEPDKIIKMLGTATYELTVMTEQLDYITKKYNEVLNDNHLLNLEVTEMRRRENDFILSRSPLGDVLKDANPAKASVPYAGHGLRQQRVSECDECATEPAPPNQGRL